MSKKSFPGLSKITTTRLCSTLGCPNTCKSLWQRTCASCWFKWRQNGDATQSRVQVRELKPYFRKFRYTLKRRSTWDANSTKLVQLKTLLGDTVAEIIGEAQRNPNQQQYGKTLVKGASLLSVVCAEADVVKLGLTVVALHLLRHQDPGRFVSDQAFTAQVSIAAIRLAPSLQKHVWDAKAGKNRLQPRQYNPRYHLQAGLLLNAAYAKFVAYCFQQLFIKRSAQAEVRHLRREKLGYGVRQWRVAQPTAKQLAFWKSGGTTGQMWRRLAAEPEKRKALVAKAAAAMKRAKAEKKSNPKDKERDE